MNIFQWLETSVMGGASRGANDGVKKVNMYLYMVGIKHGSSWPIMARVDLLPGQWQPTEEQ